MFFLKGNVESLVFRDTRVHLIVVRFVRKLVSEMNRYLVWDQSIFGACAVHESAYLISSCSLV